MTEHDLQFGMVLTVDGRRSLQDPHLEGPEASLGVTHEIEQLRHRRQSGGQGRHLGQTAAIDGDGDGGAVPQACRSHRAGL